MTVCVLGSINLDIVASVEHLPRAGETVTALRVDRFPGGKGANQAVAAARMGADTLLIGKVGSDDSGAWMRRYLETAGVNADGIKVDSGNPTGQAYINVSSSGENSIVVASGANNSLAPEDIAAGWLEGRRVFLSQLESPLATIATFFSNDAARRGITVLNAAPARADGADLIRLADIVVVNETELAGYSGSVDAAPSLGVIIEAARQLISRDRQTVVVTLGAQGAVAVDATHVHIVPGRKTRVVDTTGAGDCCCGVLAAGLGEGLVIADALELAVTAASISVERSGAATSMPHRAEVDAARAV